ncbi:cytochrome c biogenesis protein CcmE [Thioalkalivibrio denitrificans]|uniref:Cytochrome c-type biogenesis protein CcmE n=1 Tax=Thioalkalivibrio denitrificans TaxID=108003 RepID=A0A1V3NKW3_9GAMM|nr:cytochrome c maturation protein CcmE [Thioalkalivibrio denitrificans]OOG25691.1 cytochrome c biogenesis protein CcmE [Thioalkalivibrio denitrificans]
MTKRQKRLTLVLGVLAGVAIATGLILNAFRDAMVFFVTPSEVMAMTEMPERKFRIGGLVEAGSVVRDQQTVQVTFRVTDTAVSVPVTFEGILPDLFREGQGVVAEGRIDSQGVFHADKVLARHDEEYMPAEAQAAIERAGHPPGAGKGY